MALNFPLKRRPRARLARSATRGTSALLLAVLILSWLVTLDASARATATPIQLTTPRGSTVSVLIDRPSGRAPYPAVVLGSGSSYHMRLPILERVAQALVSSGVAVYRFDWAYHVADPDHGKPSETRGEEVEDMQAVLALARGDSRVDSSRIFVAGKSLGSLVAWRVFRSDPSLTGAILLTPVCGKPLHGPEDLYADLRTERRPSQWILGDQDSVCPAQALYRALSGAARPQRVVVLAGNHTFEQAEPAEKVPSGPTKRRIELVAQLVADFIPSAVERLAGEPPKEVSGGGGQR